MAGREEVKRLQLKKGNWIHDKAIDYKTMVKHYWHHSYHKLKRITKIVKKTNKHVIVKIWDY